MYIENTTDSGANRIEIIFINLRNYPYIFISGTLSCIYLIDLLIS